MSMFKDYNEYLFRKLFDENVQEIKMKVKHLKEAAEFVKSELK